VDPADCGLALREGNRGRLIITDLIIEKCVSRTGLASKLALYPRALKGTLCQIVC
jgi:hypothetical protein